MNTESQQQSAASNSLQQQVPTSTSTSTSSCASASASSLSFSLSAVQLTQYQRDGYLVIENFASQQEIKCLMEEIELIINSMDLSRHPAVVFRAKKQASDENPAKQLFFNEETQRNEDYFLASADRIHFFFEENAFDSKTGKFIVPKESALNKVGHALHQHSNVFKQFTNSSKIAAIAKRLGFEEPVILQSMCIFKQPLIGAEVVSHRDSTFLFTEPSTTVGFWLALEDCTTDNGCLMFVKGSHLDSKSTKRLKRQEKTVKTINQFNTHTASTTAATHDLPTPDNTVSRLEMEGVDLANYQVEDFTAEPVKAGSLILISADVVHASNANHSQSRRLIYTWHCIESKHTYYPETNWLQSKRPFMRLNGNTDTA